MIVYKLRQYFNLFPFVETTLKLLIPQSIHASCSTISILYGSLMEFTHIHSKPQVTTTYNSTSLSVLRHGLHSWGLSQSFRHHLNIYSIQMENWLENSQKEAYKQEALDHYSYEYLKARLGFPFDKCQTVFKVSLSLQSLTSFSRKRRCVWSS